MSPRYRPRLRRLGLVVVCFTVALLTAALLTAPLADAAKKRVVIMSFAGPNGAGARRTVAGALAKKTVQLTPESYDAVAAELGVDGKEGEGMLAVCSKIRCDAVVKGWVKKKGRKFTLTVAVLNGGTGEVIGRRAATVRGARKVGAAGSAIGAQCLALVAQGKFVAKKKPTPKPTEPPPEPVVKRSPKPAPPDTSDVPKYTPAEDDKPKRAGKGKRKKKSDDDDDEEEGVRKGGGPGAYAGLFDVSVAVGLSTRRATVMPQNPDPKKDATYEGGMYPEFTIHADVYPIAPFTRSFARNIGIGIGYTRHMSISTRTQDTSKPPVDTGSQELLLDLRVRWPIFSTPTTPEITILAGWGLRDFTLGMNDTMTSFNYRFLRFGLEGNIPFGTPYVGLYLGFDVRPLLGVGQEAVNNLGTKGGGLGFSVRGGAQGRLAFGLTYFLAVEFLRFSSSFKGLPLDTPDLGKDLRDRTDPTNGSDRFIRFWIGAGYAM